MAASFLICWEKWLYWRWNQGKVTLEVPILSLQVPGKGGFPNGESMFQQSEFKDSQQNTRVILIGSGFDAGRYCVKNCWQCWRASGISTFFPSAGSTLTLRWSSSKRRCWDCCLRASPSPRICSGKMVLYTLAPLFQVSSVLNWVLHEQNQQGDPEWHPEPQEGLSLKPSLPTTRLFSTSSSAKEEKSIIFQGLHQQPVQHITIVIIQLF